MEMFNFYFIIIIINGYCKIGEKKERG